MTTHLRARALQAGAFLALVGGMIAAAPSAALAIDPSVQITSLSSGDIPAGGKTTLKFRVTNNNLATPGAEESVTVVVSAGDMSCSGDCNFDQEIGPGQSGEFEATLTHTGSVAAGATKSLTIQIAVQLGPEDGGASRSITVRGADKPQAVRLVSGKVKDQDGKAVSGATVALRDSKGAEYNTVSNGSGGYSFTSSDSKPIAVGSLFVGATKTGYEVDSVTAQGGAGESVNIPLTIKLKAVPTSATPSATASISAPPTEEVTDDETPVEEEPTVAADTTKTSGEDDSSSMLYIILGVLLVAAGIGAIVLVLMRRKSGDDPEDDDAKGGATPSGPTPGRYGGADETRLAAPVGGRGGDATMIAPRSGAPSMADAPTMIHQTGPVTPPVDEFPDPYGAPIPPGGGFHTPGGEAWGTTGAAAAGAGAAAAGTYGAAQANGNYGAPTQYGAPPVPAQSGGYAEQNANGYGAEAYGAAPDNGYGDQGGYDQTAGAYGDYGTPEQEQRYDEPTGMYRPEANGGYPQEAGYGDQGGYGAEQPAYGQNDGYGQGQDEYAAQGHNGAYQAGGYQGNAYGAAAEPAVQGGYDSWDGQGGGIDDGNAYGPPAGDGTYGGGTYGGAQGGGNYGAPAAAPAGGTYGAAAPAPAGGNYGAPAPASGGNYGAPAPAGNYGAPAGGGTYGGPAGGGNYGAPAGGGGYGAPADNGYGEQQGDGQANGYGGDQGGYDPHASYGGQANGYPQQQVPPQQGGYGDQGGYGAEQQAGYYGGAEQQGGRHGGQPRQQPPEPAQRRQLDWLDD